MKVRNVRLNDRPEWLRMRKIFWPESQEQETERFFEQNQFDIDEVFVLERESGKLGGFLEINFRNFAEGCYTDKVPYIEGWYVDSDLRNQGYGKMLIKAAETWAVKQGYTEMGSDAEIQNNISIEAHKALGYKEVYRIVCFAKKLKLEE